MGTKKLTGRDAATEFTCEMIGLGYHPPDSQGDFHRGWAGATRWIYAPRSTTSLGNSPEELGWHTYITDDDNLLSWLGPYDSPVTAHVALVLLGVVKPAP